MSLLGSRGPDALSLQSLLGFRVWGSVLKVSWVSDIGVSGSDQVVNGSLIRERTARSLARAGPI